MEPVPCALRGRGRGREVSNAKYDQPGRCRRSRGRGPPRGHDLDQHGLVRHGHPLATTITEHQRVAALGGLYVIGTNRHESRRIDLQLRGRAGGRGIPVNHASSSAWRTDSLVRYGIASRTSAWLMPAASDEPIEQPVVRREIFCCAQRIIEGQNLEIRRTLARCRCGKPAVHPDGAAGDARHDAGRPAVERAAAALPDRPHAGAEHLALGADFPLREFISFHLPASIVDAVFRRCGRGVRRD